MQQGRGSRIWHALTRFATGLSTPGLIGAALFLTASMSPSLLPRLWWVQGAVTGVSAAIGYGLGVLLAWVWRQTSKYLQLSVRIGQQQGVALRQLGYIVLALVLILTTIGSIRAQAITASLVGLTPLTPQEWVGVFIVAILAFSLLIVIIRWLRRQVVRLYGKLVEWFSPTFAALSSVAVVAIVVFMLTDVVAVRGIAGFVYRASESVNVSTPAVAPPTTSLSTGGPGSNQTYDSLGFEGKRYVSLAPSPKTIEEATGKSAQQPIRAYATVQDDNDFDAAAQKVVEELERTKAFDRKVLNVTTTTGTGWVNEWAVSSVEYLSQGDCATAAMQYSVLPSWVAFLADREAPVQAGKALFNAVYDKWKTLPKDKRPLLVVSGESLGAFGGSSAFDSQKDMLTRAQGGVFSGTPSFTPMVQDLFKTRLQGSPQISPVIDNGDHIRFVEGSAGLNKDYVGRPFGKWDSPRFVYIQHPSDPIIWWSPSLIFDQPDWLREPRGRDVNPYVRWWPIVTFWQVSGDMAVGLSPPYGHGHRYGDEEVAAWAAVLGMPPDGDYKKLAKRMTKQISNDE